MPNRRARSTLSRSALYVMGGAMVLVVVLVVSLLPRIERIFMMRAAEQGRETLALTIAGIEGALDRFQPIPSLIAERPILTDLLQSPSDPILNNVVNEDLRQTAEWLGASDVYLMDRTGLTIAASSYLKELSFIGRTFQFRPYFTEALAGGLGQFHALGTTSGERGYFYAAPVEEGGDVIGVLALKFTVDRFESAWQGGNSDIIVSDQNGVVFMSNRPEWHFRSIDPMTGDELAEITRTVQYPLELIAPLALGHEPLADGAEIIRIGEAEADVETVAVSGLMPGPGWQVTVLIPASPAKAQALIVLLVVSLLLVALGMTVLVIQQRRARILERLEAQRQAQELLEGRVRERTRDLNEANAHLRVEVEERRAAEEQLRRTQQELVQAGKLAALGQMSAALSHEINQPLSAVKSYADNAIAFLDRDREAQARDNVIRISGLVDRIASISARLRNFARRPQDTVTPVDLKRVLDEALALMEARLRERDAKVSVVRPDNEVFVMGGELRLQQVVVNLIGNALDAMEAEAAPRIEIAIATGQGEATLAIADHGHGLDDCAIEQVFDPFFTTKDPGKGMGLGLSISYNIVHDFGGRLTARNRTDGARGAVFDVILKDAPAGARPDRELTEAAAQ